MKSIHTYF